MVYHRACRPEAVRQINQGIDRRRWASMAQEERAAMLQTLRSRDVDLYRETVVSARSHGRRWTAADAEVLIERADAPSHFLAVDLGRALFAVRSRRHTLRERGRLSDATDGDDRTLWRLPHDPLLLSPLRRTHPGDEPPIVP